MGSLGEADVCLVKAGEVSCQVASRLEGQYFRQLLQKPVATLHHAAVLLHPTVLAAKFEILVNLREFSSDLLVSSDVSTSS
jgi:hypothetical protein